MGAKKSRNSHVTYQRQRQWSQTMITTISCHFLPKNNKHHARFTFNKQKQIAGESVVTYAARLREKSKDGESGEQTDDRILEHLIQTIKDSELLKRSIQKK